MPEIGEDDFDAGYRPNGAPAFKGRPAPVGSSVMARRQTKEVEDLDSAWPKPAPVKAQTAPSSDDLDALWNDGANRSGVDDEAFGYKPNASRANPLLDPELWGDLPPAPKSSLDSAWNDLPTAGKASEG